MCPVLRQFPIGLTQPVARISHQTFDSKGAARRLVRWVSGAAADSAQSGPSVETHAGPCATSRASSHPGSREDGSARSRANGSARLHANGSASSPHDGSASSVPEFPPLIVGKIGDKIVVETVG